MASFTPLLHCKRRKKQGEGGGELRIVVSLISRHGRALQMLPGGCLLLLLLVVVFLVRVAAMAALIDLLLVVLLLLVVMLLGICFLMLLLALPLLFLFLTPPGIRLEQRVCVLLRGRLQCELYDLVGFERHLQI
jgi:hypothetical protein